MLEPMFHDDGLDHAARNSRRGLLFGALAFITVAAVLIGMFVVDRREAAKADEQFDALMTALDATRQQVESLGAQPVAPPADEVVDDPSSVQTIIVKESVDPAKLRSAARAVLVSMVPAEVAGEVPGVVDRYVQGCVASGDCVGPVGPQGEPGADPSPADLAAAVAAACGTVVDCTIDADEIADAVAAYCSSTGDPCGVRWSERQIYTIANRAVIDYLSGRPIWCPSEDSVPDDQPFGPCYVSVG